MSAPVSMPPVFDTTPCLNHLMEFEDCVIDVGTNKKQFLMPTWPTLYPSLMDGKSNERIDTRAKDMVWKDGGEKDPLAADEALTGR